MYKGVGRWDRVSGFERVSGWEMVAKCEGEGGLTLPVDIAII